MPRIDTVETTVYTFAELSDTAKQTARNWWRQHVFQDSNDWEHVFGDAADVADIFGLDIRTRRVNCMDGTTRYEPQIYFSGFSSQGDGAVFVGDYKYKKGAAKAIREYAPKDTELHRIVDGLQDIQSAYFYQLTAQSERSGRYNNSGNMFVYVFHSDDKQVSVDVEDVIKELMRDFADWIYKQLENEYNYQMSNEVVDENIEENGYEFTEDGSIY